MNPLYRQATFLTSAGDIAQAGDNIVSSSQLYGGTYNLFAHTFPRQGIDVRFASHDDYDGLEALILELLEKDPDERPPSADALAERLAVALRTTAPESA